MSKQVAEVGDSMHALALAAKAGDFSAFEALVSLNEQSIYTLAMRILRQPEDAQDVVQDTFLSALEHLGEFRGDAAFRTWLVRIATNHALKVLRRRKGRQTDVLNEKDEEQPLPHPSFIAQWRDDPIQIAEQRETQHLLNEAMESLDEKYRLIFLLRDVEGLSTEEAASMLGISVANAKVRLLRARLMLRERLTREFGDPAARLTPHQHE